MLGGQTAPLPRPAGARTRLRIRRDRSSVPRSVRDCPSAGARCARLF